tara:strand:+ start:623 stop:796 length:174 start_codon:yes stop_codon:yes gene_type:complete
MSNQEQKKTTSNKKVPSKTATNKNKKKNKSATVISLKKLRKSKEFRDLGDAFDYFSD